MASFELNTNSFLRTIDYFKSRIVVQHLTCTSDTPNPMLLCAFFKRITNSFLRTIAYFKGMLTKFVVLLIGNERATLSIWYQHELEYYITLHWNN